MALELPDLDKHPSPHIRALKKNVVSLYDIVEIVVPSEEQIETIQAVMRVATQKILDGGDFDSFDQIIHAVGRQVTEIANQKHPRKHQGLDSQK